MKTTSRSFGIDSHPDIGTGESQAVDVVGFTIAEFIPRQVMHLQQVLKGFH
jgi:hypothetical protein